MKKIMLFLCIFLIFCSMLLITHLSKAKYKDDSELDIYLTSAKMYFEDTSADVVLPYNNNTANMSFDVNNYLNVDYTIKDINYTVSISNANYTFSINDVPAINNELSMTINGGQISSQNLMLDFIRLNTANVPATEDIEVTISTSFPYVYTKTFTVTILAGQIDVQGNPTEWTNNDVTLTVVPTTQGTTLTEYSFDGGATWVSNSSNVYTGNANNIEVYAKDQLGQILGPVIVDITKIDKEPPTLTFATVNEHWTDDITGDLELKPVETLIVTLDEATSVLTGVTATDLLSGVSSAGVRCYRNDTQITTTDYFTQVGRYLVTYKVQDNIGNETQVNREILVRWPTAGKYVVKRQNVVATGRSTSTLGSGLYQDDSTTGLDSSLPFSSKYYYSGPTVNNYIDFAGTQFRILNVPVNDGIKLIGELSGEKVRWGLDSLLAVGTNRKIYDSELFGIWQNTWWKNKQIYNSDDAQFKQFSNTDWSHIENATFYAGRFKMEDAPNFEDVVEQERTSAIDLGGSNSPSFQGYSAFPNVSDYIRACNKMDVIYNINTTQNNQRDFKDNSWLGDSYDQWTMNSENNTTADDDFWVLETDILLGIVETRNQIAGRTFNLPQQYRPVFYLKNDTILSGTGTTVDPFNVEEDWSWFDPYQTLQ